MLREAINNFIIEGILAENNLEYGSYMKDGKEHKCIKGTVVVKTKEKIGDKFVDCMVPVQYFANEYKKDGGTNGIYTALETSMKELVSIAAADEASADRVRITGAQLEMNEYYPEPDRLISLPRVKGTFINRITQDVLDRDGYKAQGSIEFCIAEKTEEVVNDEPTGRILLKGIVPGYGGRVSVVPLVVETPAAIDFVSSNWNEGDTVPATISLNFSVEAQETVEEQGFGDPVVRVRTKRLHELSVTKGNYAYTDDKAFEMDEIQNGLAQRKAWLEVQKSKSGAKKTSAPKAKSFDLGF